MVYRYVGVRAEIGDGTILEPFGQVVEFAPAVAENLVANQGVALVTAEMWKARGITEDELRTYPAIALHPVAPHPFTAKRDALWADLRAWREKLKSPAAEPAEKVGE